MVLDIYFCFHLDESNATIDRTNNITSEWQENNQTSNVTCEWQEDSAVTGATEVTMFTVKNQGDNVVNREKCERLCLSHKRVTDVTVTSIVFNKPYKKCRCMADEVSLTSNAKTDACIIEK